jgi:hypothetical protein
MTDRDRKEQRDSANHLERDIKGKLREKTRNEKA